VHTRKSSSSSQQSPSFWQNSPPREQSVRPPPSRILHSPPVQSSGSQPVRASTKWCVSCAFGASRRKRPNNGNGLTVSVDDTGIKTVENKRERNVVMSVKACVGKCHGRRKSLQQRYIKTHSSPHRKSSIITHSFPGQASPLQPTRANSKTCSVRCALVHFEDNNEQVQ
jgi:hypothetical protein